MTALSFPSPSISPSPGVFVRHFNIISCPRVGHMLQLYNRSACSSGIFKGFFPLFLRYIHPLLFIVKFSDCLQYKMHKNLVGKPCWSLVLFQANLSSTFTHTSKNLECESKTEEKSLGIGSRK